MPRQHKKYDKKGKKRKREEDDGSSRVTRAGEEERFHQHPSRQPGRGNVDALEEDFIEVNHGNHQDAYGREDAADPPLGGHDEFYGLLSDDDQAYFKRIEAMLELDQFETPEERDLLLDSVWHEADGKELKLACSQSCSRVLERLIKLSRSSHLKKLFQSFSSHFVFLVQHRFASHCCETLFLSAAPMVTQELIAPMSTTEDEGDPHAVHVSMENMFLYTVNELSEHLGFLMTDRFASHPIRVLIVALSGKPLSDTATVSSPPKSKDPSSQWRTVPQSFHDAVQNISATMTGGLETHYLRTLTTSPNASQIIQRLLELEFVQLNKSKAHDSLFRRLVPEDAPTEDTETGAFLKGLLYDGAGSRLLEVIVQCAPGKIFKGLYTGFFEAETAQMAKNDIASFVLIRILERLNAFDLSNAIGSLLSEMPVLFARQRHAVLRALIEYSRIREIDTQPLAGALEEFFGAPGADTLPRLLQLRPEDQASDELQSVNPTASKHHARNLLETMLSHPTEDPVRNFITSSLLLTPDMTLLALAQDQHASHVIQTALKSSLPPSTLKSLIQNLLPHVVTLAPDPIGSHVVDALWYATDGSLFFLKERVTERLAAHETTVRETLPGRAVWRNWRVELYGRRRVEWVAKAKGRRSEAEFGAETGGKSTEARQAEQKVASSKPSMAGDGKSAIEKARERWLAKQKGKGAKKGQDARVVRVR